MDGAGNVEVPVTKSLRGYPDAKVGTTLRGRLVDIRKQWFKFDGNVPHVLMPFTGSRVSLVFFTRSKIAILLL